LPGDYQVVLNVNGKSYSQPLTVKLDPRLRLSAEALTEQLELSRKLYELRKSLEPIGKNFVALATALTKAKESAGQNPAKEKIEAFAKKLEPFTPPNSRPGASPAFHMLESAERLFDMLQEVDAAPTVATKGAVAEILRTAPTAIEKWTTIVSQDLPVLNQQLVEAGLGKIELSAAEE
jgi:hypothetical protein